MIDRSRHIPEHIVKALMEEARGRCCLCRELVIEGSNRHEAIAEVLEKHHLIYFSAGGEHTSDNLLLVDPNCHSLIHHRPEAYPTATLRAAKERWRAIASRFPKQILYKGPPPVLASSELLRLAAYPFSIETYGVSYSIIAPDSLCAAEFARYLKQQVVDAIAVMDDNTEFLDAKKYYLSLRTDKGIPIPDSTLLRDIQLGHESLVLNMHINIVARAAPGDTGDTIQLQAIPGNPKSRETYQVTISHTYSIPLPVVLEVEGTDGFKLSKNGVTFNGRFSITVPGGVDGVRDSIVARGGFGLLRLMLVFGEKTTREEESVPSDILDKK